LVLTEPVLAMRGDRFILRDETARHTLGGGVVVHPFADRHRRRDGDLGERLGTLRDGAPPVAARALLELIPDFACDRATVAQALNLRDDELAMMAAAPGILPVPDAGAPEAFTTTAKWQRLEADAAAAVTEVHRTRPLVPGVEMESLRT